MLVLLQPVIIAAVVVLLLLPLLLLSLLAMILILGGQMILRTVLVTCADYNGKSTSDRISPLWQPESGCISP